MQAGRDVRVDFAQRREDRAAAPAGRDGQRPGRDQQRKPFNRATSQFSIFLGNLAWDVTTELVEDMINDVLGPGLYTSVRLATDRDTGRMRGFGHVDFKDNDSAERAVTELNGLQVSLCLRLKGLILYTDGIHFM